jgi:PAS domain S-box-containing protein
MDKKPTYERLDQVTLSRELGANEGGGTHGHQGRSSSRLPKSLAVLPIPVSLLLLGALSVSNIRGVFEPPWLLPLLNTAFLSAIPFLIAYITIRAYLGSGSIGLLMLSCGVVTLGLSAFIAGVLIRGMEGPNTNVTIYNSGALLAAAFHFYGSLSVLLGVEPDLDLRRKKMNVINAYLAIFLLIGLLVIATVNDLTPLFFIQGVGPTLLRQIVLGGATALFAVSAFLLTVLYLRSKANFLYWYSLALFLIAIGLACVFFEKAVGSPIGWLGRSAQYLGCIYLLAAVLSAVREVRARGVILEIGIASLFQHRLEKLVQERAEELARVNENLKAEIEERKRVEEALKKACDELEQRVEERTSELVREIEERKRAEESVRESEERFRTIFEQAAVGVGQIETETGRFLRVNQKYCDIVGYTREEMTRMAFMEITHPDDLQRDLDNIEGLKRREIREAMFEKRYIRKDGSAVWVNLTVSPMWGVGEKPNYHIAVIEDIMDRKEAQEALRVSALQWKRTFDSIADCVSLQDSEGKILRCNKAMSVLLGKPFNEIIGRQCWNLLHGTSEPIEGCPIMRMRETLQRETLVLQFADRWLEVSVDPLLGDDGVLIGAVHIVSDITHRRRLEEILEKERQELKLIIDSSPIIVFFKDKAGRFIRVNKAFAEALSMPEENFVGKTVFDLFSPKIAQDMTDDDQEVLKSGRSKLNIIQQYESASGIRWVQADKIMICDKSGIPVGLVGFAQDITERKQAEEERARLESQLQQARKMEAIGLLAGGVAHDLNNILSGIVGYPDLLLLDLPKDSPIRRPIEVIKESGQRAADVVSDLLTVARGIASSKEVSNLNSLVEEYSGSPEHKRLESMRPSIAFETVLEPELLNVSCSPVHIKKTLMNLVTNASEAIEGMGTVRISTMNRYLDESLKGYEDVRIGEYAVLTVSDDGTGISREDLERIFEPFYTKKVMGRTGTGLGLTVVWNTVQDHGGYIDVSSSEKGTTFELYFPTTREEAAAVKQEVPIEDYLGHGEKILVVDDEQRQREIACGLLSKLGYTAEAVSSGEEAIEYVKDNPVDLIVLDMIMPKGINGRETYEEIIKIHPGQKAIIASGFSKTEDVKIAQKLGAGKYIKKPYTLEKIGIAVKEELKKSV